MIFQRNERGILRADSVSNDISMREQREKCKRRARFTENLGHEKNLSRTAEPNCKSHALEPCSRVISTSCPGTPFLGCIARIRNIYQ